MKKIITLVASAFVLNITAQNLKEADVPAAVKEAFTKQYPSAKNAEWEKEDGNFEAEFKTIADSKTKKESEEISVLFDASGKFIKSETEIKVSKLPKAVYEYVKSTLAGKKIKEAAKITDASGAINYEAEIDKIDYLFDAKGTFLKKEVETDNDMDGKND